jgi:hypothetical protein
MVSLHTHSHGTHDAHLGDLMHHGIAPVVAASVLALAAGPAHAGEPVNLSIAAGHLTVAAPAVTAVSGKQLHTAVVVRDSRGTGKGWMVTLTAPAGLKVASIAAACAADSTCTLPSALDTSDASIVHAAPGTGMGAIKIAVTFAPLPAGAHAGPVRFGVVPFVA